MKIRKATLNDVEDLEQINKIAKEETGWWIPQNFKFYEKFLKNKNNEIQLVRHNNEIVGFLSIEYNPKRKSVWVNDIYVNSRYRKNGIAKKLITKVLDKWKNKSNSVVLLTANRNLPIFKKMGFKKTMNFMEFERKNIK